MMRTPTPEVVRLKPWDLGAGWQARHNQNPKHEGLAGTRARFIRLLSKAPGKKNTSLHFFCETRTACDI
jgi:hypothetical protein